MLRSIKNYLWILGLLFSLKSALAFVLLQPLASWQVNALGYNPLAPDGLGAGPAALGGEYRRNTPFIYYAYDPNFAGYFGSNGEAAVEQAISIMNNVSNVDSYSTALTEFPLGSKLLNPTAGALELTDLKSTALHELVEQMGLGSPTRYVWTLEDRLVPTGAVCPVGIEYLVVQRNYDISQLQASSYINGEFYQNAIYEFCKTAPLFPNGPVLATTIPFSSDPLSFSFSSVASDGDVWVDTFPPGYFHTGLTRDDVAGLRYLISTNNVNFENAAAGSLEITTNNSPQILVTTLPFSDFVAAAATNSPAQLLALYPGLVIVSSNSYFTNIPTPNIVVTLKEKNGSPIGSPPIAVTTTNGSTPNFFQFFTYVFGNIYTNSYSPTSTVSNQITTVTVPVGSPVGTLGVTNTTGTKSVVQQPGGDFFIIPTTWCGFKIVQTLGSQVIVSTNNTLILSNLISGTNLFTGTQTTTTIFTNHTFVIQPETCQTFAPPAQLRQGVGRIQFIRVADGNVDSLTHNFFVPITNNYSMVLATNNQLVTQFFQRIVTTPDILFDAQDLPGSVETYRGLVRNLNFNSSQALPGLSGPGTIDPVTTITFNSLAPIYSAVSAGYINTNQFLQLVQAPTNTFFAWASFGADTNDPVVYPNGTSLQNLESQLLIQVSPSSLPVATNGTPYSVTFTATGGQPPYTWSLASGSQLPQGLSLSAAGVLSGTPVGNPSGIYDFTLQLNDSSARIVQWSYSITIQ